jgi:hypothetical protein
MDVLSSMTLFGMSKMVPISCRGKEAILAQIVAFETFTLSVHEVFWAKLGVVVFLWVVVVFCVGIIWFFFLWGCLRLVLVF